MRWTKKRKERKTGKLLRPALYLLGLSVVPHWKPLLDICLLSLPTSLFLSFYEDLNLNPLSKTPSESAEALVRIGGAYSVSMIVQYSNNHVPSGRLEVQRWDCNRHVADAGTCLERLPVRASAPPVTGLEKKGQS